jgi:predicted RNase H-like nuclease (RuvC/YqgF family)
MDLMLTPDVYEPSIDENGNFIDKIPSWSCLKGKGIMCACGSRKNKIYETSSLFTSHIRSQTHKKWIEGLNANKVNLYMENIQMKKIIHELRQILNNYEKEMNRLKQQYIVELSNKEQVIKSLTSLISDTSCERIEVERHVDLLNI